MLVSEYIYKFIISKYLDIYTGLTPNIYGVSRVNVFTTLKALSN